MEGRRFLHRRDREELRERWLLRSGQAFERMFAEANQDQLVTFTEREDMACLLGNELSDFRRSMPQWTARCVHPRGQRGLPRLRRA